MNGVVWDAKQNGRLKLDVPVVVLVFLRKSKAHYSSGVAVQVVSAGRLKPIPDFVSLSDASGKGHTPELDRLRVRLLRRGYGPSKQKQQTNE